jgi:hypothetical protein
MNLRTVFTSQPIDQRGAAAREKAASMMDEIISGLTAPLTEIEKSPKPKKVEKLSRIVFKGTLEEVQRFFYNRGWTDGLPIIPATEEAVKEMLAGTSHSPEEVMGLMPPESWETTVEGVAINAVMAGCKPEHMPVLLATVEASISGPMFYSMVRSTGSFSLMQIVNGPIAEEIGMNSGLNALGPGCLANVCIGRALRLFIINLGGSVPGVNLMASQGNVAARGLAIAENEKESPWEPFHVSRGYKAEESVLTMMGGEAGFINPGIHEIPRMLKVDRHRASSIVLLDPLTAKLFVERQGFKEKKALQKWLWENTKVTIEEWRDSPLFYEADMKPKLGKAGWWPEWYADPELPLNTMVHVFPNPDTINVIVVGGGSNITCQVWQMRETCSVSIDKWR